MRPRQRIVKGSLLHTLKSTWQWALPIEIEEVLEEDYGVPPFGLELPRVERVDVPKAHPAWPYLNCHNHDGGMFGVSAEQDSIVITMNDHEAWRFAGAYDQWLGHPYERGRPTARTFSPNYPAVPVELHFRGLREWGFFQSEINGKLCRLKHSLASNLRKVDAFAYDCLLAFGEEGLVIIFELRLFPARHTQLCAEPGCSVWRQHDLFIAINAAELEVVERQREAWVSRYGEQAAWLWDQFAEERRERHLIGWDDVVAYVEELHKARALD